MVIFDPWKSKCMKTMISDPAAAVMIIANERLEAAGPHNSTEHPFLISIPYIHPIGQYIAIEIGYPISIQINV